jgi:hypothetical protein
VKAVIPEGPSLQERHYVIKFMVEAWRGVKMAIREQKN